MPAAAARASASRRDLPLPVSPAISISDPDPRRAPRDRRCELGELGFAADQRELESYRVLRGSAHRRTYIHRVDRTRLALHGKRLERRLLEASLGALEHAASGVEASRRSLRHQPRREVDRVAHHRVPAAVGGPELTSEHRAPIDPGPDRERQLGLHDLPQREEHALLVVAHHPRGSGAEPDLGPVGRDVRVEEADLVTLGCVLDYPHELIHAPSRCGDPVGRDDGVEAAELKEGDDRGPVLGRHVASEEVGADGTRQARGDRLGRRLRRLGRAAPRARGRARKEHSRARLGAHAVAGQQRGRPFAQEDLAGRGRTLHRHHGRRGRAPHEQLAVRPADQEHRVGAAMHADRHPQDDLAAAGPDPAGLAQRSPHPSGRRAGPGGVILAREPQQHRVAAELQQRAAELVGAAEQRGKARVDRVDEVLGALLAPARETLGQAREPRHVREHHRPLELLDQRVGRCRESPEEHPRDVAVDSPSLDQGRSEASPSRPSRISP